MSFCGAKVQSQQSVGLICRFTVAGLLQTSSIPRMNLYWLSRDGGPTEGPFAEDQLLSMWRAGSITVGAMVCLEGTDDWVPVVDEIRTLEQSVRAMGGDAARRARAVAAAEVARAEAVASRKGAGVAAVLNFFFPGLGHVYAGELLAGLAVFVLTGVFASFGWATLARGGAAFIPLGIAIILWLVALMDSAGAVRRAARKL
jgi:hypothetical protein